MKQVAVITRTRNRPILLKRAVRSVASQTFTDLVHVIVNDGGDKAAVEHTLQGEDLSRIVVIHNDDPRGMENASNLGIRALSSSSEFIAIHDDDDSWAPTFLEKCVSAIKLDSKVGAVVTQTLVVHEDIDGDVVRTTKTRVLDKSFVRVGLIELAAFNRFPPIAMLFRRSSYEQVGPFNTDLKVLGDWEFNLRLSTQFDIVVIPEVLANWHHRSNISSGPLGNSVIAQRSDHVSTEQALRNQMLRSDIQNGKLGLGWLVNIAPMLIQQRDLKPSIKQRIANLLSRVLRGS